VNDLSLPARCWCLRSAHQLEDGNQKPKLLPGSHSRDPLLFPQNHSIRRLGLDKPQFPDHCFAPLHQESARFFPSLLFRAWSNPARDSLLSLVPYFSFFLLSQSQPPGVSPTAFVRDPVFCRSFFDRPHLTSLLLVLSFRE